MDKRGEPEEETKGSRGPLLLYVLLAVVVGLLLLFLILRPRGTDAGPSQKVGRQVVPPVSASAMG